MGPIERTLRDAAELYKEHGYAGRHVAVDDSGNGVEPTSPRASRWCVFGSITAAGSSWRSRHIASNIFCDVRDNLYPHWSSTGKIMLPDDCWDEAIECAATGEAEGWL